MLPQGSFLKKMFTTLECTIFVIHDRDTNANSTIWISEDHAFLILLCVVGFSVLPAVGAGGLLPAKDGQL